jgi:hypothetical protein
MELTDVFITVTTVYKIPIWARNKTEAEQKAKEKYETAHPEDLEGFINEKTVEYVVENP